MRIAKPLVRWTIGPVADLGYEILLESVVKFSEVYPEFDRVICYNNIDKNKLKKFENHAQLHEQTDIDLPCGVLSPVSMSDKATGCGWKLSPPRLRINSLELFLDNDVVIFSRIKEIDDWIFSKRHGIITEGKWRIFGGFESFVNQNYKLCAGLFGLPPFLNFYKHIRHFYSYFGKPLDAFDEQGLSAAVVSNMKNFYIVPIQKLRIVENHDIFPDILNESIGGIHFVGINRKIDHNGWRLYKKLNKIPSFYSL